LTDGLAWGGGIIALALGVTFARKLGYIEGDGATRLVIGLNGLMIAHFGNLMPKSVVPSAWARQVKRVGGWAIVLSGLIYTGLFVFAPIPVALRVGSLAIVSGIAVTIGYSLWLRANVKTV
jgi:hypothetical protein